MSNDGQNQQDSQNTEGLDNETGRGGSDEAANNPGTQAGEGNAAKDPKDWTTGDEPATPAQKSYMSTMAVEAGEAVPDDLTKAQASKKINELQQKTGRDTSSERP